MYLTHVLVFMPAFVVRFVNIRRLLSFGYCCPSHIRLIVISWYVVRRLVVRSAGFSSNFMKRTCENATIIFIWTTFELRQQWISSCFSVNVVFSISINLAPTPAPQSRYNSRLCYFLAKWRNFCLSRNQRSDVTAVVGLHPTTPDVHYISVPTLFHLRRNNHGI